MNRAWGIGAIGDFRLMQRGSGKVLILIAVVTVGLVMSGGVSAQQDESKSSDLSELSLEELLDVEVTSVSKKAEPRTAAPAAIFVITNEDIRRSGATSIPEALRMAPGLNVARLDTNKWSVTSRGFAGRFANKLLVLIDGRSIYTPLFSGVYWEANDVMLEDVERIEVIRGPGGTVWGANAVNGVINIVTKSAENTQGGLFSAGGGTEEKAFGSLRYGGSLGEDAFYRLYVKYFDRDEGEFPSGDEATDDWQLGQGGFRLDWNLSEQDTLTVSGDYYGSDTGSRIELAFLRPPRTRRIDSDSYYHGGNIIANWTRRFSEESDLSLQVSYGYYHADAIYVDETRRTFDIELTHRFALGERQEIVWGAGFRYSSDSIANTPFIRYLPDERRIRLLSGFVQDEITLIEDELKLTLGSKFEGNDFTGLEVQPSVRVAWTPDDTRTLWGAVSRAVRTPSRAEDNIRLRSLTIPGASVVLVGQEDFESEELLAVELGYRLILSEKLTIDIAGFYNHYTNLRTIELRSPSVRFRPLPVHLFVPFVGENNMAADTYGLEATVDWKPKDWWRLRSSYSLLEIDLDANPVTIDLISGAAEEDTPNHQVHVQSSFDLPHDFELDVLLRYVDRLPAVDVDDYVSMDVRLGWSPRPNLSLEVVGQNLIESEHLEFRPTFINTLPTETQRGVYGKVTWEF